MLETGKRQESLKGAWLLGACLFTCQNVALAKAVTCSDLSHTQPVGGGLLVNKQVGCKTFLQTYKTEDGDVLWTLAKTLAPDWVSTRVDDDYETYEARHRWSWSSDGKSLSHDFHIDGINKTRREKYFKAASEVYSEGDNKTVQRVTKALVRVESSDGRVDVSADNTTEHFEALD